MSNQNSNENEEKTEQNICPVNCPNRISNQSQIGKGYIYGFTIAIVILFLWQSVDLKYSRENQWQFQTKEVPSYLIGASGFLLLRIFGVNTDSMAELLGKFLSSGAKID